VLDRDSPFREVWVRLGQLRERLEVSGYDVTAEGMQLLNTMISLENAWQRQTQPMDAKFYDEVYLLVRQFGNDFGNRDKTLPKLVAEVLKALVQAKKALIGRETDRGTAANES
jgi:hypothetical protein